MDFQGAPRNTRANEPSGPLLRRTTVLTLSQRVIARTDRPPSDEGRELSAGLAVSGGSVVLPGLRAEERLLLGLVDGRLSVARLARLSGLSEDATIEHLRALCSRRVLVPVETTEVTIRGKSGEASFSLGPYEVFSKIGQGGMGSVYAARRTGAVGFRRVFAVKVVRQDSGQERAAERSFLREVRIGTLLDHPNTQSVIDVGTYKNQPYLVLQFIEGTNLEEVSFGRRMPPDILATILVDVLRGLQRAHDLSDEQGRWLGLVHGDVSPPNILIGTDGVARLTDFGSARFAAQGENAQADPMNLGKPAFMAPEQLFAEPLDARTDIFAAGVVMWTALTGRPLFMADNYEQIIANVLRKEIEPPSVYGAPPPFDEVCIRALSRSRENRYGSAEEMARALLGIGFAHGLLAAPTAVGAYVRRELAPGGDDPYGRLDAARRGGGEIHSSIGAPASRIEATSPPTGPNLAKTMVIPHRAARAQSGSGLRKRLFGWVSFWAALGILLALLALGLARLRRAGHRSGPAASRDSSAPLDVVAVRQIEPARRMC